MSPSFTSLFKAKKGDKPKISRLIVSALRSANPPSRFLQCNDDTNQWEDVGDKRAAHKISVSFQNLSCKPRKKKEKAASSKADDDDDVQMENEIMDSVMRGDVVEKKKGKKGKKGKKSKRRYVFKNEGTRNSFLKGSKQASKNRIHDDNLRGQLAENIILCKDEGALVRRVCDNVNAQYDGVGVTPISTENDPYLDGGFTAIGPKALQALGELCGVADAACKCNKKASKLRVYLRTSSIGNAYLGFEEGSNTNSMAMHNQQLTNAVFQYTRPKGWMDSDERKAFVFNYNKDYNNL